MKKVCLLVLFMFLLCSVGLASPLTDYSKGKAAIDLTYRASDMDTTSPYNNMQGLRNGDSDSNQTNFDGKGDLEVGITLGLGNNFAFQYRGLNAKAEKTYSYNFTPSIATQSSYDQFESHTVQPSISSQEYNVLYKLNKSWSAFAGIVKVKPSIKSSSYYKYNSYEDTYQYTEGIEDKTIGQVGIIGYTNIAKKTNLYGIASLGNDYRNWEAGLSYELRKDTELNVSYRSTKYDNLKISGHTDTYSSHDNTLDLETKGWGFGLTYKF